jgi:uncharacterized membrane protein
MTDLTPSPTSPDWASVTAPHHAESSTAAGASYTSVACTFEICGFDLSYWSYRPSKSINLAFAVLFGISALAFTAQGIASKKRWMGFTVAMVLGCVIEVVGYVGRAQAYDDLYTEVSIYSSATASLHNV